MKSWKNQRKEEFQYCSVDDEESEHLRFLKERKGRKHFLSLYCNSRFEAFYFLLFSLSLVFRLLACHRLLISAHLFIFISLPFQARRRKNIKRVSEPVRNYLTTFNDDLLLPLCVQSSTQQQAK